MLDANEFTLSRLLGRRLIWGSLAGLVLVTAGLGYWVVEVQAFEAFYEYSRAHESWQMDHVVMVALVFVTALGMLAGIFAFMFRRRLIAVTSAHMLAERRLQKLERQAALGTLLGGMAHHVNNHLQPVILLTQMVLEGLPNHSEGQKDLSVAHDAATRASGMLTRIKKITQVETEPLAYCPLATTLQALVQDPPWDGHPAPKLQSSIAPLSGQVALSQHELTVVLQHLLTNAADASGQAGGLIQLQLREGAAPTAVQDSTARWGELQLIDNGCGMDAEAASRLFQPFFTTKPPGKGLGLGLAEVQALVHKAGGSLQIASTPGQGTVVTVLLPLH